MSNGKTGATPFGKDVQHREGTKILTRCAVLCPKQPHFAGSLEPHTDNVNAHQPTFDPVLCLMQLGDLECVVDFIAFSIIIFRAAFYQNRRITYIPSSFGNAT